ncbi:hypothetical protein [Leadbetterella sp. DM7]|uniref:hypothetical protein n=1 Tax=Leadbetterella sp. DM7 TaxID=3235085 RepID=UPI00349ED985
MMKLKMITLAALVAFSCGGKKKSPVLDEAYEVHKEIREIQKEVIAQWTKLDSLQNSPGAYPGLDSAVAANKSAYDSWKHDLLEIPGYPHIHLEGDVHEHHHQEQSGLPDEQILEIQKASRSGIEDIFSRNHRLLEN